MNKADLVIHGARQLLTMDPSLASDPDGDPEARELGAIRDGALAALDGLVVDVGTSEKILDLYDGATVLDASECVVTPGFVDPHTHTIFAGSRHMEFGVRMRGGTYLDILAAGGGIHSTVEATRLASEDELVRLARPRLDRALGFGVTTMEIKSGYGLDIDTELKILSAVARLDGAHPVRLIPTYLGAHVVPLAFKDDRAGYVRMVIEEAIPRVAEEGLAAACDVYLDEGAFSPEEAERILLAARAAGLALKIHAGQFTDKGGPELIARLGGLSADHLEVVSDAGVAAMSAAGVVANLLPGAAFSLRDGFPSGRRFIEAGVRVALATDNNPGSSRTENLPLMASMGAARMGLTCAEAVRAITANAAAALGMEDRVGGLRPGQNADAVLLAIPDFRALLYHFGVNHTATVVAGGRIVVEGMTA